MGELDRAEVPAVGSGSGEQFRAGDPYEVAPEPTDTPDRVAYGAPQASSPVAISTIVGDIVHNSGSALDSLAHEMALCHLGRPLKDAKLN